jgi:hypothetical protein
MKAFSSPHYKSLYGFQEVRVIFKLFKELGLAEEMIDAYPKMKQSEERYREVIDSILDFQRCSKIL